MKLALMVAASLMASPVAAQDWRIRQAPNSQITTMPLEQYRPPTGYGYRPSGRDFTTQNDPTLDLRVEDQWVELLKADTIRMGIQVTNLGPQRQVYFGVRCIVETTNGPWVVEWMAFDPDHIMRTGQNDTWTEDVMVRGALGAGQCVARHRSEMGR